jgi:hypothetical protein
LPHAQHTSVIMVNVMNHITHSSLLMIAERLKVHLPTHIYCLSSEEQPWHTATNIHHVDEKRSRSTSVSTLNSPLT